MLSKIQTKKPQKNKFDLSRESKLTGNMGYLYPAFVEEVIPGDSFKVNTQQLVRFSPLLSPVMHRIDFKLDYFFVPYRLLWTEWKDFITGGEDGNDLPSFPRFNIKSAGVDLNKGSLADYLGLPVKTNAWKNPSDNGNLGTEISLLYFRAYQLIYHEYFRDQNVGDEIVQYDGSGVAFNSQEIEAQMTLRRSNWEKDYFTSALPFLQRGNEVTLPLGELAPLVYDSTDGPTRWSKNDGSQATAGPFVGSFDAIGQLQNTRVSGAPETQYERLNVDVTNNTFADLSEAQAISVNELRKASALQQWLELMARAGSRYREQIFAIFGERIPDYTVQVPQYLGGGKTPIMISEVLSTYQSNQTEDRPQGDMTGHAIGVGDRLGFTQSFDEHGVILGLARVIPKSSYTQGVSKFFQKFDKFDHFFPQFANLGEQEIKNIEIYAQGNAVEDNKLWAYQQRYAEYKYANNTIAGDFHDNLAYWEMSRRFEELPQLNQSFIECAPDDRIFAITDENEDKLWISLYHDVQALRPIPYHANPMLT